MKGDNHGEIAVRGVQPGDEERMRHWFRYADPEQHVFVVDREGEYRPSRGNLLLFGQGRVEFPLGMVLLEPHPDAPVPVVYITFLVVDPGLRNRGWGSRMVRRLLMGWRNHGHFRMAVVAVSHANSDGLRFWEHNGFVRRMDMEQRMVEREDCYILVHDLREVGS